MPNTDILLILSLAIVFIFIISDNVIQIQNKDNSKKN